MDTSFVINYTSVLYFFKKIIHTICKLGGFEMEKGRKTVHFCLLFVVLVAIVVGMFYYYGQLQGQTSVNEGTLISKVESGLGKLCQ